MKIQKLLVTPFFFLICMQICAQVKVLPNGKVGIGAINPQYGTLEIGKSGVDGGLSIYDDSLTSLPLRLYSQGEYGYLNFGGTVWKGIAIKNNGRIYLGNNTYEELSNELVNLYISDVNPSCAMVAFVHFPHDYGDVVKVVSYNNTDVAYNVRDASKGGYTSTFQVFGDGTVYAKNGYLTASDERFKENISEINNGLDIIQKMRGVTYTLKGKVNKSSDRTAFSSDSLSMQSDVPIEIRNIMMREKDRKKVGFIAQELEKIFPEAVYTTTEGTKAIAYSEIIPLLVEAIKEQQNEIDELKQSELIRTRSAISNEADEPEQPDTNSLMDDKLKAKLYSNIPNPFKERTNISFFIPETAYSASIHIYNLQGNQIKQLCIDEKGNSSIVINGFELTPGMYMYTLIVDGKEIDTKKMILTE